MKAFNAKRNSTFLIAAIGATLGTSSVLADSFTLEEIVVTAQKRAESLQDVPISLNAVDGSMMQDKGISNLEDVQAYVPNFALTESGLTTTVAIRGIFSGQNQAFEQSVGTYVDGIHTGRGTMARAPFLDLERVEVLRGPQSILFGKNSVAGALNITTAKPTDEFEGSVSVTHDNKYDETETTLVLSGPLSDTVRGRLAVRDYQDGGYIKNTYLDEYMADKDESTFRGTIDWDITNEFALSFKAETSDYDRKGRTYEIAEAQAAGGLTYGDVQQLVLGATAASVGDDVINGEVAMGEEYNTNTTDSYTLTLNYDTEFGTFTAVSGVLDGEAEELCDCDFTGADIFSYWNGEEYEQFSQEFRFVSPGGEKLDYILGAFYQTSEHNFEDAIRVSQNSLLPNANPATAPLLGTEAARTANVDSDSWSVFASATYSLTDTVRATLGYRITKEEKEGDRTLWVQSNDAGALNPAAPILFGALFAVDEHSVKDDISETKSTPSVNVQWDVNEDVMLYASWAIGYKSGGFDFRANNPGAGSTNYLDTFAFDPEKATNFEIGGKTSFMDGRGELNFAIYHMAFDDLQVSIYDGTLGFNVGNAAASVSKGIELDGRFALTENTTARYSAAFSDFEYQDFENAQCYAGQTPDSPLGNGLCSYSGERAQLHSEVQATLGFDHTRMLTDDLELSFSIDGSYVGENNPAATLEPTTKQDAYTLVGARLGITSMDNGWSLALIGQNLTDKEVIMYSANQPLAYSTFGRSQQVVNMKRPRTVAIQARYEF